MTDISERLRRVAGEILGRALSSQQLAALERYMDLLLEWNRVQRLTSSGDRSWIADNIVLDSLLFSRVFPESGARRLLDVGSGAGVPGVPLKIVFPELEVVLVEARRKRASFLSAVARALGASGLRVVNARAETLEAEEIGTFDVVTARCSGELRQVAALAVRHLDQSGVAIISGPPGGIRGSTRFSWTRVANPLTGGTRSFAVIRADS